MRILVALPQPRTYPTGCHRPPPLDAVLCENSAGANFGKNGGSPPPGEALPPGSPANLTVTTPIPQSLNPGPPLGQASVMAPLPSPLAFVLLLFSGWVNRQQQAVIDYLIEENRRSSER